MTSTAELAARRDVYALASRLLAREVDAPLHRRLVDAGLAEPQDTVEDLAVEYCRLFVGPGPVCLPYASAQRGALLRGRPEQRFLDFLARHDLDVVLDQETNLLARDHLAVELAVLAHLYSRALDAPEVWDLLRTLLAEHLLPWGLELAEVLAGTARHDPYRTLGALLAQLLRAEPTLTVAPA